MSLKCYCQSGKPHKIKPDYPIKRREPILNKIYKRSIFVRPPNILKQHQGDKNKK